MYDKITFDTMQDYLKACNQSYVPANLFFDASRDGYICWVTDEDGSVTNIFHALPSDSLRAEIAREFEKYFWMHSNPARLEALSSGTGADFSQLHTFYVGDDYFSTSIGGDMYDACLGMFTQSTKQ